ncbi:hypothetical protein OJF2_41710 [Aquisphaera giovannonii]|uniref:HEPN domain-containing protein n=1 Tax=Aquisphaera giovannonii TaxID=406548 RepID=A0A5B9W4Z7_9BACT|nr:hypothetical protein [Aquisphaera giovannonii]QEH35618.1 hypothetical protein OJF2_41710 [Aquisphaera giovannonii]
MIDDPSRAATPPAGSRRETPPIGANENGNGHGNGSGHGGADAGRVVETTVSPFHCLYQDALFFHTQSRLAQSEGDASRLARAALVLYVSAAEALVRQAAVELGRPELRGLLGDPSRPLPLAEAWRLLPAIVAEPGVPTRPFEPEAPPWPQFAELLMLKTSWIYPGPPASRRAYYRAARKESDYEPMEPHNVPGALKPYVRTETLTYPRTGLPRDPYALRPRHLDTARGVLDAAIEALDRRMGGTLCHGQRHRREPTRVVYPPENSRG